VVGRVGRAIYDAYNKSPKQWNWDECSEAALSAVTECSEVEALVEAALGLLIAVGPLPTKNGSGKAYIALKNALTPFAEVSNG